MNKLTMVVMALALAGGCKKEAKEVVAKGSDTASGSAPGSAVASGSAAPVVVAAAKPTKPEDFQKQFETCWGYFSDGKLDDFKTCYAADAVLDTPGAPGWPQAKGADAIIAGAKQFRGGFKDLKADVQFEAISGHTGIGSVLVHGSSPDGKKVGFYFSHVVDWNDDGKITHEWHFYDFATLMGQLQPNPKMPVRAPIDALPMAKVVAFTKDDATEKANLETFSKLSDAMNKHDVKAAGDLLDDKVMWEELSEPKGGSKQDVLTELPSLWKWFSDLKFTVSKTWAAGDYVIALESFDGTNDADGAFGGMKKTGKKISLPILAIYQIKAGKVTAAWLTYQQMGMMDQLGMPMPMPAMDGGAGSGSAK